MKKIAAVLIMLVFMASLVVPILAIPGVVLATDPWPPVDRYLYKEGAYASHWAYNLSLTDPEPDWSATKESDHLRIRIDVDAAGRGGRVNWHSDTAADLTDVDDIVIDLKFTAHGDVPGATSGGYIELVPDGAGSTLYSGLINVDPDRRQVSYDVSAVNGDYFVRWYGGGAGTAEGQWMESLIYNIWLEPLPLEPEADTEPATSVSPFSTLINATITDDEDEDCQGRFRYRDTSPGTWTTTNWSTADALRNTDAFDQEITDLTPGTEYEFQAQARTTGDEEEGSWSASRTFTTAAGIPDNDGFLWYANVTHPGNWDIDWTGADSSVTYETDGTVTVDAGYLGESGAATWTPVYAECTAPALTVGEFDFAYIEEVIIHGTYNRDGTELGAIFFRIWDYDDPMDPQLMLQQTPAYSPVEHDWTIDVSDIVGEYRLEIVASAANLYAWATAYIESIQFLGTYAPVAESHWSDSVGATSATIYGQLVHDGNEDCEVGFDYREVGAETWTTYDITGPWRASSMLFGHGLHDLEQETAYEWYFWAENTEGRHEGETLEFTTLLHLPGHGGYLFNEGLYYDEWLWTTTWFGTGSLIADTYVYGDAYGYYADTEWATWYTDEMVDLTDMQVIVWDGIFTQGGSGTVHVILADTEAIVLMVEVPYDSERQEFRMDVSEFDGDYRVYIRALATWWPSNWATFNLWNVWVEGVLPPTVETLAAVNVTDLVATIRGQVTFDGNEPCTASFEYRELDASTWIGAGVYGTFTTGEQFTASLSDLEPDTTYEFRAVVTNDADSVVGATLQFTTEELDYWMEAPVATTNEAHNITDESAWLSGTVFSDGGLDAIVAFQYKLGIAEDWTTINLSGFWNTNDTFTHQITGLDDDTEYDFRAVVTNIEDSHTGATLQFTTYAEGYDVFMPDVQTTGVEDVAITTVTLHGRVLYDGGVDVEVRFHYGRVGYSTETTPWQQNARTNDPFLAALEGLTPGADYRFWAEVRNPAGSTVGAQLEFTTLEEPPPPPGLRDRIVGWLDRVGLGSDFGLALVAGLLTLGLTLWVASMRWGNLAVGATLLGCVAIFSVLTFIPAWIIVLLAITIGIAVYMIMGRGA